MKKLYDDAAYQDVSFIFNSAGIDLEDPPTQTMKIGAHKLVLTQWPYFKSMFEGGFAESGDGAKQIKIEDIKPATFRLMIKLMYFGNLNVMGGLDTENAIPFLFRAAYLYDELRAPVVKYAATSCVSVIASKDFQSNYLTHPQIGALLYELFIEK
ncbi:hypothetical protein BGZ93_003691 [Podila epicladia]|nr:hypothetical protein BGZ93_003691 [Podila epicladia]